MQVRNEDVNRVIERATALAGGNALKAWTWFRSAPIPELDGKTAELLVEEGRVEDVIRLLEIYDAGAAG